MSLRSKILIFIGAILVVGALAFIIFKQVENSKRQDAIEMQIVQQKQLLDGITRSSSQWGTKEDIEDFIKNNGINLKVIQQDLDKLHAEVTAANVVVVSSQSQHISNLASTSTGDKNPTPDPTLPDPFGYNANQQTLSLSENFGNLQVPIGSVGFSAWQKNPWNLDIKAREYHVSSVVGTDENQRMYFENKFTVKIDGKSYDIPVQTATTKQIYPTAKFSWWNPELFLAVDGGVRVNPEVTGEFIPNIRLGIMSYGKYKTQPTFSILQVGVGLGVVSKKPQLVVAPIMYNLGENVPLIKNTYIGPSIGVGLDGGVTFMGSIGVGL